MALHSAKIEVLGSVKAHHSHGSHGDRRSLRMPRWASMSCCAAKRLQLGGGVAVGEPLQRDGHRGPPQREQDAADWRTSVGAANHDGSSMAAAAAD